MRPFWRWVFSDLFLQKRFTFLFVLNLSLGLTGFVALDSFRHSLEQSLGARSRFVLGADLGMTSRQPFTSDQRAAAMQVLEGGSFSEMTELYSMVAGGSGDSRLVQIKAIDAKFPFYGEIVLRDQGPQNAAQRTGEGYDIHKKKKVWVYPEVLLQLGLQVGDSLKVGEEHFTISDIVEDDAASGFSTSMAPRIYIGREFLRSTALITPQSLAWHSVVFKYPNKTEKELQETVEKIFDKKEITESVRVYSHSNVSQQMSRMLRLLSDYLGLVAVAAIFLASLGATYLFRSYLATKVQEIAIFRSLGMSYRKTLLIYLCQILFLGVLASFATFVFSFVLTPGLKSILQGLVSVPINLDLRWQSLLGTMGLATIGSLLIGLPVLAQMKGVRPATLFQSVTAKLRGNGMSRVLQVLALICLWLLSVWQSKSWLVGSGFVGVFLLSGVLLGSFAFALIWLFDRFGSRWSLTLRMPLRNLARQPKTTISCFLALGLGVMLLNVIPQVEASLQTELEHPEKSKLPSFFLFDIQDEQVEPFRELTTDLGASLEQLSPMVRSRLSRVNGEKFEKVNANKEVFSREEQREARFRNRGFNLSYREELSDSETIVDGEPISGRFDPLKDSIAEVSVEKRFADRLDLKIGDLLEFDVQSVPIQAKVVNLRSVRWTSFQPNFFIQFQPGVLEEAPKTFVAAIGDMSAERKLLVQNAIVKELPNVSIIDVTRIVRRLSSISQQMSVALQFMALLCLFVGFLVMYSIASHQAAVRKRDINLIKVLGAKFSSIRNLFILEFSILALFAGILGVILSVVISYLISSVLFDSLWSWDPWVPIFSLVGLLVLVVFLSYASVARVLRARPSFYL